MQSAQILVVEDENIVARDLQYRLGRMGYEVPVVVATGEDAIQRAAKAHPDLILMDIVLQGEMDGVQAAEEILRRFDIPVVFLTAYGDDQIIQRAKTLEPLGYLLKPFKERELHATIQAGLYRRNMDKRLKESEERFRTCVATMLDPFAILAVVRDPQGRIDDFRIDFLNAAAAAAGGAGDLQIGRLCGQLVPDYLRAALLEEFGRVVNTRQPLSKEILIHPRADSDQHVVRAYDICATALGDGLTVTWRDISERKQVDQTLSQVRSDLEHRVQERTADLVAMNIKLHREIGERVRAEDALRESLVNQEGLATANERLYEEAQRRYQNLQAIHEIDKAIACSLDRSVVLNIIMDRAMTQLNADAMDMLLFNAQSQVFEFAAGRGFRTQALAHSHIRPGTGHAGRAALERRLVYVPDLALDPGEFDRSPLFGHEGFVCYYGVPLISRGQVKGILEVLQRTRFSSNQEWIDSLEALAGLAAIAVDNAALFEQLERSNAELAIAYDSTLEGWSRALDLRDKETEGHTQRVAELTLKLCRAMQVAEADLGQVYRGALLHDIGKMGIPDAVLLKPGSLTPEEWEVMRQHPTIAHELLSQIAFLRSAIEIPYCHHEKWNGTGYPRGLAGERIPMSARIFAVVDVWDALLSDRPYRPAWSKEKAIEYIREQSGIHFDPQVVGVFLRLIEQHTSEYGQSSAEGGVSTRL